MTVPPTSWPHLIFDDGEARLERMPRIRVSMIAADYLGHGWSAEQIAEQYPHLNLAEIHSALAYYHDHREEIEAVLEREIGDGDPADQSPSALRLKLLACRGI